MALIQELGLYLGWYLDIKVRSRASDCRRIARKGKATLKGRGLDTPPSLLIGSSRRVSPGA